MSNSLLRDEVFAAIRPRLSDIMLDLLPRGKGKNRFCPFHDDKTPSLSYDLMTSAWRCHVPTCDAKGDVFALWMRINHKSFGDALRHFANMAGMKLRDPNSKPKYDRLDTEDKVYMSWVEGYYELPTDEVMAFHKTRYGLEREDWIKNKLFWNPHARRLWIPAFGDRNDVVINIRQHDTMRHHCSWHSKNCTGKDDCKKKECRLADRPHTRQIAEQNHPDVFPKWDGRSGKVISVAGHGSGAPLFNSYELANSPKSDLHYIVGGELKKLLMTKVGYTAFTFMGGEGKADHHWIPYFQNRKVRILMDPDEAGCTAVERLTKMFMDAGCDVEAGIWKQPALLLLPPKGDVTDLILQAGASAIEDPEFIQWVDLTANQFSNIEVKPVIDWSDLPKVKFANLSDPRHHGQQVVVSAVVSGLGDNPYQVPHLIMADCAQGRATTFLECKKCVLAQPKSGHINQVELDVVDRLDLCGKSRELTIDKVRAKLGIPTKCKRAALEMQMSSVQPVILTTPPTWEESQGGFMHRPCSLIFDDHVDIIANTQYTIAGTAMASPHNNQFILAAERLEPTEDTALSWRFDPGKHNDLDKAIRGRNIDENIMGIVADWRDHCCKIYDQDEMLISMLLAMFMPFEFYINGELCARKCPHVVILGDSNVGKSTAAQRAIEFWGGGRFVDFSMSPTFAGLIGGQMPTAGGKPIFAWGVFPSANKSFLALDEFNKVFTDDIGKLTGMLSSGVASRVMSATNVSTACFVRFLSMANCRNNSMGKKLVTMQPYKKLFELFGSSQDLGRVEFAHIESTNAVRDFTTERVPMRKVPVYTKEVAKYHLAWAWQLDKDKIEIDSMALLRHVAILNKEIGDKSFLTLSPQLKWKVGRVACGIATLCYQASPDPAKRSHLIVDEKAIVAACNWIKLKFNQLRIDAPKGRSK